MKKIFKTIGGLLALLLGAKGSKARKDAVDNGICDYSGCGRDTYGK